MKPTPVGFLLRAHGLNSEPHALSAFLLGLPHLRDIPALEEHIQTCDDCCALLAQVQDDAMTTLAREAAYWWTETGLFPDGACFLSFENPAAATPEHIALSLGSYLEGDDFVNASVTPSTVQS